VNFSKSWGISSRLSPKGIQIALEKPPIERLPQVFEKLLKLGLTPSNSYNFLALRFAKNFWQKWPE
jgi:hypothetical protein